MPDRNVLYGRFFYDEDYGTHIKAAQMYSYVNMAESFKNFNHYNDKGINSTYITCTYTRQQGPVLMLMHTVFFC